MLKFVGDGKNGRVYFFGFTRDNINRLVSGQPIPLNLADMGGPDINICVLFGETEHLLFNSLKAAGHIPSEVELREAAPDMTEVIRIKKEEKQE